MPRARSATRRPALAALAAALLVAAVAAALLPPAAAQTTFAQGPCEAGSFQVKNQNGCFIGTCAQYLRTQAKEAKPGTLKPALYKAPGPALCCRCNAETTDLPAAGDPTAPAVLPPLPKGTRARPSCAAGDFAVFKEDLCTPTRCAQELTNVGRKPGPGTKVVLKTYQGISGAPCCRCVVEPATADSKCEANDVTVDSAEACTLERCAAELGSSLDDLAPGVIRRGIYKNKAGATCCHCALKVKGVGTADGSPLIGDAAAPAPKPAITFVGGSGAPDQCNEGDFEVPNDNGCFITACADALKKRGKDPSKGMTRDTYALPSGTKCCHCAIKGEAAGAAAAPAAAPDATTKPPTTEGGTNALVKTVLQLDSTPFPLPEEQRGAVLDTLYSLTGAAWVYRAQQPATADGQPKLPASGSRRLLLQADGTAWWLEADGTAPADVTGVYFMADAAVPSEDADTVGAALTAASGDLLTSSLTSKGVETTAATVLFAGSGPVMFGGSAAAAGEDAAAAADASSSGSSSDLSGAEYFGIALAVVLGVAAVVGGTMYLMRRRRRQSRYTTFEGDGLGLTTTTSGAAAPQRAYSDGNHPARMQF